MDILASSSTEKTPTTMKDVALPFPVTEPSPRKLQRRLRIIPFLSSLLTTIRANLSAGTPPSSSTSYDDHEDLNPQLNLDLQDPDTVVTSEEEDGFISKVVVEQSWGSGTRSKPTSDSSDPASHDHKDSKSGETQPVHLMKTADEREVDVDGKLNLYLVCLLRFWLKIKHFFYPRPFDVGSEKRYDEDDWYSKKTMAQLASIWLILNLALGCVSVPRPWTIIDLIFNAGIAPAFTVPIFVMIMYNWPRDHRVLYQFFVVFSLWMWPFDLIITMRLCGFYDSSISVISCNGKDFINILFYATAMQAIGLFGLRLDRLPAAIAAAAWFVLSCTLIIPDHTVWWRSVTNFAIFHVFLIWVHERRESSERRLYAMKVQVKIQYKALQRAQEAERRTSESKHRLTSYVFHEVRVPLNSALLAAQSMEASGTISKALEVEFDALMGSLTMMSQVLNDVLDFNRLDSGQFELVSKPYAFHQTIRALFIPLQMATAQKGLTLHTELDPNIDKVARRTAYRAMGEREDIIERHLNEHPDVDGVVIGDEARFRQIITNFASNACKFTPEGGSVTVKTKLLSPSIDDTSGQPRTDAETHDKLSASRLAQHDYHHATDDNETIVVRVEVTDTGCGIEESELAGSKLFSAFNQTERGKQQGGKGTGLGLALVRNIVKLSGGRLGVKSQSNKGSTFWVELPLGVGRKALIPSPGINIVSRVDSQGSGSDGSMGSDVAKVRAAAAHRESQIIGNGVDGNKECRSGDSSPVQLHLRTNNSLAKVVDAAALKASDMSSVMRSSDLMHSTIMEQNGRVDLVVDSQTPSFPLASIRASPSIMNGTPTPNTTDLSFSFHSLHSKGTPQSEISQNLSIGSGSGVKTGIGSSSVEGGAAVDTGKKQDEMKLPASSLDSGTTILSPASLASLNSGNTTSHPPLHEDFAINGASTSHLNTAASPPVQRPTHISIPATPHFDLAESETLQSISTTSPRTNNTSPIASPLTLFDNSFSRSNGYNANIYDFVPGVSSTKSPHPHHTKNNSVTDFSSSLSILVVDDDGVTRMMMDRLLRRQGCDVTTAENGRVALELILGDEWDPDMLELEDTVGSVPGSGVGDKQSRDHSRAGSRSHSRTISLSENVTPDLTTSGLPSSKSGTLTLDQGLGLISRAISQGSDQSQLTVPDLPRFAVIFLDNSMPVLSGQRTVEILRRLRRRDFVVGLTGNALLTDQDEYLRAGVDIVLTKPVMQNKLLYVLKEADARRQHHLSLLSKVS
ncbi:hypothetical protein C8J55DRAFT_122199 [Lentinula edodes]|uniref:histidine kinase n=1 Tax=Lentinula lateritia TaxID=40482 RepID=A0A9W9A858_9AGAR|nr:hypothetical protein C8J55DRAFT_122199 [Lentinula edodes]